MTARRDTFLLLVATATSGCLGAFVCLPLIRLDLRRGSDVARLHPLQCGFHRATHNALAPRALYRLLRLV